MHLVTLRHVDPVGIWVDDYPAVAPFWDSILVPDQKAYDLAQEWETKVIFLSKVVEYDYLVYLPTHLAENVRWCAERLHLL